MPRWTAGAAIALLICATSGTAQERAADVQVSFIFNGERIKIARAPLGASSVDARFVKTASTCGGPCVAPMQAAPGVATLGELEVIGFLESDVAGDKGLMVDARTPEDRAKGFIPGTVSLPHITMEASNTFRHDILRALGAREFDGVYNFADARTLLVYDDGPSSMDAAQLVSHLLEVGYPPSMIRYYRGGMQVWSALGFSIEQGRS